MVWEELRKRQKRNEILYLMAIFGCLIIGTIAEIIAFSGHAKFYVLNFDAVSLTIIQIQASVQTLSIALLALASAQMDRSFMGITYNDYHFNLKPWIFTQKRIILSTIVLLIANVFFHMAELYNIVTTIFIVVCILIVISVMQIYGVFADNTLTEEEIEQLLLDIASSDNSFKKIDYLKRLSKDWTSTIEKQSQSVYERYYKVYASFSMSILCDENSICRSTIQDTGVEILLAYSKVQGAAVRIRALSFLSKIYSEIASTLRKSDEDKVKKLKGHVWILNESFYDIWEIFGDASINDLEKAMHWPYFIEDVFFINYSLDYDSEKMYELNSLSEFVSLMARCLAKQKNADYTAYTWEYLITSDRLRVSIPEQHEVAANVLYQAIRKQYLLVMIRCNMYDFVKNHYYKKLTHGTYSSVTKDQAILFLSVYCYVIYISEYEDIQLVTEDEKKLCRAFLESSEVKKITLSMLTRIGTEEYDPLSGGKVYTTELIDDIYDCLRRFEILPSGEAKMIIMDTVVMDVITFSAALMSSRLNVPIIPNIIGDNKEFTFYSRYIQNTKVYEQLNRFLDLLNIDQEKAVPILTILQNEISKSVKASEIKRAHNDHKRYLETVNEEQLKQNMESDLLKHFNEQFSAFISEKASNEGIIHMHIFSINDFSSSKIDESLKRCYNEIDGELVRWIAYYLLNMGSVKLHNRDEFSNDDEYFKFLNSANCDEILGSDFVFRSLDYKNRSRAKEFFEGKKFDSIASSRIGIMTQEEGYRFWIQKIKIGLHPGLMSDQNYSCNDGKYYHEVSGGITLEFTRQELEQYLRERRVVVDIVADISIQRKEGIIGQILQEK